MGNIKQNLQRGVRVCGARIARVVGGGPEALPAASEFRAEIENMRDGDRGGLVPDLAPLSTVGTDVECTRA